MVPKSFPTRFSISHARVCDSVLVVVRPSRRKVGSLGLFGLSLGSVGD